MMFFNMEGNGRKFKKVLFELLLALIIISLVVQANITVLNQPNKKDGSDNNILFPNHQKLQATGDFISTWNTANAGTSSPTQITLPLQSSGTYDFLVDWGDVSSNTITAYNQPEVTHTYSSSGIYTVTISGTIKGWQFNNGGDKLKIIEISQWGTLNLGNSGNYFYGASNLNLTATDAPDLTGTTTLANAFFRCTNLGNTGNMSSWNVSAVTNMNNMFTWDNTFNQSIGDWNVSSVTDMSYMFAYNTNFNQPIGHYFLFLTLFFFQNYLANEILFN